MLSHLTGSSGLAAEIRRVFDELERDGRATAGECMPPIDVYELADMIVIVVDLPGVPAATVRALVKDGVLVVAGEKPGAACSAEDHKATARFHLAEREFGRFARAVRLPATFDVARARATLKGGELQIRIPRIEDRRGSAIEIPIGT
jgi:HSP20 family protein